MVAVMQFHDLIALARRRVMDAGARTADEEAEAGARRDGEIYFTRGVDRSFHIRLKDKESPRIE